jgi:hypothetical protein
MSEHTDVGAYAMGLLEPHDRQAFEQHLTGCRSCSAELAEMSGMAALLRGVEPAETADEEGPAVTDLIRRRATRQRHRARWQAALGAAAGIVLLAGGIGIGVATAPGPAKPAPPPPLAVVGQVHSATSHATGASGTVGLVTKAWGTQVTLDLSGVRGPLECELVAVSKTGERRVVLGWLVPAAGYGVPGHPAHLVVEGGTSIPKNDLTRVEIDVVHGGTLLSIPL